MGVLGSGLAASGSAAADGQAAPTEVFLFTVQSQEGKTKQLPSRKVDERFTLTLTGIDPVTQFSDRPFRDALLISPQSFVANWDDWFAGDPPNAVLTFARPGLAPGSMVVTLTNPRYVAATRTLKFTAIRDKRLHDPVETGPGWQRHTTPTSFTSGSLFIDSVTANSCMAGGQTCGGRSQ